ncbi:hypothetical protein BC739_000912 [Kutzneria viridogrisea]|uniref:Uncharacterized protein n=1 Tax=Kutzneria viridogrisea TaxID=47990 RepID=A0ABR6BA68_9PSEU|nr:hypothetical protein [Kutzneria albida]MBA8923715.1 hypothetical protein [Kutzneria viridogrisea]
MRALQGLVDASAEDDALLNFWELESALLRQKSSSRVTPALAAVLITALGSSLPEHVNKCVLELVLQIVRGQSDSAIGEIRQGLWMLYSHVFTKWRVIVENILRIVETDQGRLLKVLAEADC